MSTKEDELEELEDLDAPDRLELAPELEAPETQKKGFWKKLKRGLLMTHTEMIDRMGAAFEGRGVLDETALEYLEESLIGSDIGVETALELVDSLRRDMKPGQQADFLKMRERLADEIALMLLDAPPLKPLTDEPAVLLMVGVNGVGKTTTIAKLARYFKGRGERVLLAAGDTFRAAAVEQISLWGERLGVPVVKQRAGADPAAVVFDALQASRARKVQRIIVDTAGRLHTKDNLMAELAKIHRIINREAGDWQRRTLLVLDATTGQNAIIQAREFAKVVEVDGVVLTKLDGTAKGGMAVAVARDLRLPVLFLGVGEGAEDLVEFRPREFASALLGN